MKVKREREREGWKKRRGRPTDVHRYSLPSSLLLPSLLPSFLPFLPLQLEIAFDCSSGLEKTRVGRSKSRSRINAAALSEQIRKKSHPAPSRAQHTWTATSTDSNLLPLSSLANCACIKQLYNAATDNRYKYNIFSLTSTPRLPWSPCKGQKFVNKMVSHVYNGPSVIMILKSSW